MVLQGNLSPRGRGGGQRAVRPISHRAPKREGRGRTGASGGRVGERIIRPCRLDFRKQAKVPIGRRLPRRSLRSLGSCLPMGTERKHMSEKADRPCPGACGRAWAVCLRATFDAPCDLSTARFCRVITPPAGGAGGSELSGRSRPERPSARGEGGRARAGGGWGRGSEKSGRPCPEACAGAWADGH